MGEDDSKAEPAMDDRSARGEEGRESPSSSKKESSERPLRGEDFLEGEDFFLGDE